MTLAAPRTPFSRSVTPRRVPPSLMELYLAGDPAAATIPAAVRRRLRVLALRRGLLSQ